MEITHNQVDCNNRPYIAGRFKGKTLLVMGTGHTLWDDLTAIWDKHKGHLMAVNRVILDFATLLNMPWGAILMNYYFSPYGVGQPILNMIICTPIPVVSTMNRLMKNT